MQAYYENKGAGINFRTASVLSCQKHLHNHIEFCIMLDGETNAYADGKGGRLSRGEAFIAFPNQVHEFKDERPFHSLLLIFPPETVPELYKTFTGKIPKYPIIPFDLEQLLPMIDLLQKELTSNTPFAKPIIIGCLSILLGNVFRNAELQDVKERNISAIKSILLYCSQHYKEDITLENVAQNVHLSKYYISHIFSKEITVSFTDYINALRIREAENLLLCRDMSVTEIAFSVGFNSLRSFNRHFLTQTGRTPREIRKDLDKNLSVSR